MQNNDENTDLYAVQCWFCKISGPPRCTDSDAIKAAEAQGWTFFMTITPVKNPLSANGKRLAAIKKERWRCPSCKEKGKEFNMSQCSHFCCICCTDTAYLKCKIIKDDNNPIKVCERCKEHREWMFTTAEGQQHLLLAREHTLKRLINVKAPPSIIREYSEVVDKTKQKLQELQQLG